MTITKKQAKLISRVCKTSPRSSIYAWTRAGMIVNDDAATIETTDGTIYYRASVNGGSGSFRASFSLSEFKRADGDVSIEDGSIAIGNFFIASDPYDEAVHYTGEYKYDRVYTLDREKAARALLHVSKDESRYTLTCVTVDSNGNASATDSYTLYLSSVDFNKDDYVLIPQNVVKAFCESKAETMAYHIDTTHNYFHASFSADDITFDLFGFESGGKAPDYHRIVTPALENANASFSMLADDLAKLAKVGNVGNGAPFVALGDGVAIAQSHDRMQIASAPCAHIDGAKDFASAINADYITRIAKTFAKQTIIFKVEKTDAGIKAIVASCGEEIVLAMPVMADKADIAKTLKRLSKDVRINKPEKAASGKAEKPDPKPEKADKPKAKKTRKKADKTEQTPKAAKADPKPEKAASGKSAKPMPGDIQDAAALMDQKGITYEWSGLCLWITDRSNVSDADLISIGCKFANKRAAWYFRAA